MPESTQPRDPRPADLSPKGRQYSKPTLTEYGSVAKLTQGTATKQGDGGGGGFRRKGCL